MLSQVLSNFILNNNLVFRSPNLYLKRREGRREGRKKNKKELNCC